jgi:hypothetical protein
MSDFPTGKTGSYLGWQNLGAANYVLFFIDQVFVLVNLNNIKLLLGCVYIPPNTTKDEYILFCE